MTAAIKYMRSKSFQQLITMDEFSCLESEETVYVTIQDLWGKHLRRVDVLVEVRVEEHQSRRSTGQRIRTKRPLETWGSSDIEEIDIFSSQRRPARRTRTSQALDRFECRSRNP